MAHTDGGDLESEKKLQAKMQPEKRIDFSAATAVTRSDCVECSGWESVSRLGLDIK